MERYWLETGTKLHKTYESACNYGNDYSAPDGRHEVVFYADAQATVEALQAQVKQLEHGLTTQADAADMWYDEFLRIRALNASPEINGICDRALDGIPRTVPVVQENHQLRQQVAALQRERDEARHTADVYQKLYGTAVMDRAIVFNEKVDLQTALDAEREKRTALLAEIDEGLTLSDNLLAIQTVTALYDKLAQLQALVRVYKEAVDYYAKTAISARAVDALEKAATLDALTPATKGGDGE